MTDRIKHALVESYVGAIALGLLLSQGIARLIDAFVFPLSDWLSRREPWGSAGRSFSLANMPLRMMIPDLFSSALLLSACYFLFRWLYLTPLTDEAPEPAHEASPPSV